MALKYLFCKISFDVDYVMMGAESREITVFKRLFICLLLLSGAVGCAFAQPPQPVANIFKVSAFLQDARHVVVTFNISPGHYLYRDHFKFTTTQPNFFKLGSAVFPQSEELVSSVIGKYGVYSGKIHVVVPISSAIKPMLPLVVHYQGCAQQGYCYPPQTKLFHLKLAGSFGEGSSVLGQARAVRPVETINGEQHYLQLLQGTSAVAVIITFFIMGALLSLTPCLLPMIPIVSSIIVGAKPKDSWHGFTLSLSYVLGMAFVYALAGLIFSALGLNIQLILQKSWVIILFGLMFVFLSLAMFGVFQLQLPSSWRDKLSNVSNQRRSSGYLGVFLMGVIATLMLSPCVTPPFVAALVFVSHSGDMLLGVSALFFMGLGIGLPLLILGVTGGKWLPRSGVWMETINCLFGAVLLALAVWMFEKVLNGFHAMLLFAVYMFILSYVVGFSQSMQALNNILRKFIASLLFLYASIIAVGAFFGATNPIEPFRYESVKTPVFITVDSKQGLERALQRGVNRPIMLDFYADWCVSCKEFDRHVLTNAVVIDSLKPFLLIRINMTDISPEIKELMQKYHVVSVPTIIFLNKRHSEVPRARIVGDVSVKSFLHTVAKITPP